MQLFEADNFSRGHFQMHFFLGALRVTRYFQEHHECQAFYTKIRSTVLLGLIWIQTVCKSYQQTILVGNKSNIWIKQT